MASRRSTRASASRNDARRPAEQGEAPNMKPRRRREQSEASAFLSKTYAMINGLDGTVGGWSDAGDSMVILDAENFASEVIPQYFKHNNFRSFVRQLNFYGFRKLRADPSAGPSTPPRWEFKHVNFRRGRPELLVQIRRAEHYDYASPDVAAQRQRQLELEREVGELRGTVATLQRQIDRILDRLPPDPEHYAATAPPVLPLDPLAGFADEPPGSPRPAKRAVRLARLRRRLAPPLPVPDVGALGYAPHSLDGAALHDPLLEAIPADARHLEGAALRRVETAGHGADLEGRPLAKATSKASSAQPLLTSFETARLDSLIRTLPTA
ncbi:DNA binding protein [Aureococcus anophagefferens]|nr:DNA binding protein [Aureococcus anophagefferens]